MPKLGVHLRRSVTDTLSSPGARLTVTGSTTLLVNVNLFSWLAFVSCFVKDYGNTIRERCQWVNVVRAVMDLPFDFGIGAR